MQQYLDLLKFVLEKGEDKGDWKGEINNRAVFGYTARYNLQEGFPLLTTKKLHLRSILYELLWFLQGSTDNQWLNEHKVTIWDEWASAEECAKFGRKPGDLGPIYGAQWRRWQKRDGKGVIDQIANVIEEIKTRPYSKRLIVTAWNPEDVEDVTLAPCHSLFKFYVAGDKLSLQLFQRSADVFLGVPFNIASYSLLLMMVAQVTGLKPWEFVHTMSDTHLYHIHFDQAKLQLTREPRPLPKMTINPEVKSINDFKFEDFTLSDYNPHPHIKAAVTI